jgi:prophage antirepressor-like protein
LYGAKDATNKLRERERAMTHKQANNQTVEVQVFKAADRQLPYVLIGDEVWFPAIQVAEMLGYKKARNAIANHCEERGALNRGVLTEGGLQDVKFIDEANLYRLILKSKLPGAVEFQTWVCAEVLPSIRKTGQYNARPTNLPTIPQAIQQLAQYSLEVTARVEKVEEKLADVGTSLALAASHATETNSRLEVLEERTAPPDFSDYLTELEVRAKYFPGVNEGRVRELLTAAGVAWSYKTLNNVDVPVAAREGLEEKAQQVLQSVRFAGSHGKWWLFTSPFVLTGKRFAVHEENKAPGVQELWRPIVKKGRDKPASVVALQTALNQKTEGFPDFFGRVLQVSQGSSLDYTTFKRVLQQNGFKSYGEQAAFERWLKQEQGVKVEGRGSLRVFQGLALKKQNASA